MNSDERNLDFDQCIIMHAYALIKKTKDAADHDCVVSTKYYHPCLCVVHDTNNFALKRKQEGGVGRLLTLFYHTLYGYRSYIHLFIGSWYFIAILQ